jgi:predicted alpha/beta hydrolase family esterase
MPKLIIITGRNLQPTDSFYPFLLNELNFRLNSQFETAILSVSDYNNHQAWLDEICKQNYDTETYVVAHSAGALAFCRYLNDNNLEIRSLHIVGGVFDQNLHPNQGTGGVQLALDFKPSTIDYKKVAKSCWQIYIHHSLDDDRVDYSNALKYKQVLKKASLLTYNNKLHFRDCAPFPELTNLIIKQYEQGFAVLDGQKVKISLIPKIELPLLLPQIEDYTPTKDGSSPLKKSSWYKSNNKYHEPDTMPNWAGSSWYYLRFCDPHNPQEFASQQNLDYWLPVDHYFGGNEHTTVHLLYSRFWHRFLYNQDQLSTPEPYQQRTNGGILLGSDGAKMSKSRGNGINPREKLDEVGADALRLYICFIGPYEATVIWQDGGLKACKKLVETIYSLHQKVDHTKIFTQIDNTTTETELVFNYHTFIKNLISQIQQHKLNVAVAEIMTFTNFLKTLDTIPLPVWTNFLKAIAPFAPFVSEELWFKLSNTELDKYKSIHLEPFPNFIQELTQKNTLTLAIQINGKIRTSITINNDLTEETILALTREQAKKWLEGKNEKFVKIIPGKLVSFVVE